MKKKKFKNRWTAACYLLAVLTFLTRIPFLLLPLGLIFLYEGLSMMALKKSGEPVIEISAPEEIRQGETIDAKFALSGIGKGPVSGDFKVTVLNTFTEENVRLPGKFKTRWFGEPGTEVRISETMYGWIQIKTSKMTLKDPFEKCPREVTASHMTSIFVRPEYRQPVLPKHITKDEKVLVLMDNLLPGSVYLTPSQKEKQANLFFSLAHELLVQGYRPSVAWMKSGEEATILPIENASDLEKAEYKLARVGFAPLGEGESSIGTFLKCSDLMMYNRFCFVSSGDGRDLESLRALGGTTVYRVSADLDRGPEKASNQGKEIYNEE